MDKDALRQGIIDLLDGELTAMGLELVDVRLFAGGGRLSVRVFVDRPGGIDLGGCATASRTIDMLIEEAGLLAEAYVIEVSSPGVRRPLRTRAHFAAAVGQRVELRLGRVRSVTRRGVLLAVDTDGLRLQAVAPEPIPAGAVEQAGNDAPPPDVASGGSGERESEFVVAWSEVAAANLDPDFDIQALINADRRRHRDARREQQRQAREARQARTARRRRPRSQ